MTHEDLISHLAQQLGWSNDSVSAFIDTMMNVLKSELNDNQTVLIDDFGKFVVRNYPEYILKDGETNEKYLMPPVLEVDFESENFYFTPEDSLNESINSVFSLFEPVRINDGADFPDLEEVLAREIDVDVQEGKEEEVTPEKGIVQEPEEILLVEEPISVTAHPVLEPKPIKEVKDTTDRPSFQKKKKAKKTPSIWLPIAGGVAVALAVLFFFKGGQSITIEESTPPPTVPTQEYVATIPPVVEDTVEVVLPQQEISMPPREIKKVRLAPGNTLRLLALDLFGSREFWIYIYMENKDRIKNPNQVPGGLELIVPDQTKYDIDANNPNSVSKAIEMGAKILNAS